MRTVELLGDIKNNAQLNFVYMILLVESIKYDRIKCVAFRM